MRTFEGPREEQFRKGQECILMKYLKKEEDSILDQDKLTSLHISYLTLQLRTQMCLRDLQRSTRRRDYDAYYPRANIIYICTRMKSKRDTQRAQGERRVIMHHPHGHDDAAPLYVSDLSLELILIPGSLVICPSLHT